MPTTTKALKVSRLKLRPDQLIEINLDKLPAPPDRMLKLPGVEEWWQALRLKAERDQQAFHRMLTQISNAATTETSSGTTPALTFQQILDQLLPILLGLFIKKLESDSISGGTYVFTQSGSNMRWKNGQLQIKSDNANSSAQQLWHTVRVLYVDDVASLFVDQAGEA